VGPDPPGDRQRYAGAVPERQTTAPERTAVGRHRQGHRGTTKTVNADRRHPSGYKGLRHASSAEQPARARTQRSGPAGHQPTAGFRQVKGNRLRAGAHRLVTTRRSSRSPEGPFRRGSTRQSDAARRVVNEPRRPKGAAEWTGFHRIRQALWGRKSTADGARPPPAAGPAERQRACTTNEIEG